ncbi:hypothetical protein RGUI_2307 [Rhodovulum sp. P5]|uniref:hypothetical protein n=1 Tax=Rhodovulum sp. P5 TaxID=1564506 RepID=UPI0009C20BBF|nr:hypothetical protein [Rhodovulum sp. P5]ARE40448.1 hypothetical protein RGUI_2307 [Rhodovulum sp. P5]
MKKLYAIACVIGWGFFAAFTYLALASVNDAMWMPAAYAMFAFAGFMGGTLCWVRMVDRRH